jgi:hypothetical protein
MHDVGSSIPFTKSSSHNTGLIPIFFRSAHAWPWSLIFLSVLSNVSRRFSHTFFLTCITSFEWWTFKSFWYGSSPKNQLLLRYVIFFNTLASPFPLTEDNIDILNHFIYFMTGVSFECSINVSCILFFMSHSNTESLFHWNNVDICNIFSCSVLTSYMPLENH